MSDGPLSDGPLTDAPHEELDPGAERRLGFLGILALHVIFAASTAVIGRVAPIDAAEANDLFWTWVKWLGLGQGIYVIPACITAALLQRWQMLVGMGVAIGVTLVVGVGYLATT